MTYLKYSNLLKNPKFLRWQLSSDETLNSYWENLSEDNPVLKCEINKAIEFLKKEGLNKSDLTISEREDLLIKILNNVDSNHKRHKTRRSIYSIAASVASVFLIVMLMQFLTKKIL